MEGLSKTRRIPFRIAGLPSEMLSGRTPSKYKCVAEAAVFLCLQCMSQQAARRFVIGRTEDEES